MFVGGNNKWRTRGRENNKWRTRGGENNKWKTRGGENNKWKTRASCSMSSTCVVLFWRVASLHGMVFAPRSCLCCPLGLHDEFACLVANADDDALAVEM